MEATIRPAKPQDKESLTRMRNALQNHTEASNPHIWRLTEKGRRRIPDQVDEMLDDPDGLVLIAEEEGTPIGFAYGRITRREEYSPSSVGFINLIYVEEGHRRRGTGTRMVGRLTDFFRSRDAEEANLGYIKGNTQAENFWKKLGFTTVRITANTPIEHLERRTRAKPQP